MTSPNTMTPAVLLELAALDAFGLLEDYEAALYDKSFHEAPASVQDEIIRLQSELASDISILPDDEPDGSLRERVLEAVSKAMEQTAPLATIGGSSPSAREVFALGRSGQFWRAACFVFMTGLIVSLVFLTKANQHSSRIAELALSQRTHDELTALIGPTFEEFINNPNCTAKAFAATQPAFDGAAVSIYHNESTGQAFLFHLGLPEADEPYTLRYSVGNSVPVEKARIESNGFVGGLRLDDLPAALIANVTWEITDALGIVVLRSS